MGDAITRHAGLVPEDASEVADVRKHLVLHGQEGSTGVNEVNAGEMVLVSDRLGTDVLFHRHRIVGAALHRGVVSDEEALSAVDHANAGDDACRVGSSIVEFVGSQGREFEKSRSRVNDALDAFSGEVLSSGAMPFNVLPATTLRRSVQPSTQFIHECEVVGFSPGKVGVGTIDSGRQPVHVEPSSRRSEACT